MKRRRISLLLMGVLPLLAKDDIPSQDDEENELRPMRNAAETMHNDVLTSLPRLQLIDLSSNANSVLADYSFDINLDMEDGERSLNDTDSYIHHHLEHGDAVSKQQSLDAFNSSQLHSTEPISDINPTIETGVEIPEDERKDVEDLIEAQDISQEEGDDTILESNPEPNIDVGEEEEEAAAKRVMVDYANKSAGALILERSPSMKGASNLLTSDRDKYAIAPCKDKKFVVVGLSEDILVKQIKIANYELYSSHVKDFQVLGSQTMGQWVDLGTFTANQGNGEQSFDLSEPSWARYLKFRFISHYRDEHFCTLSQIQVHGSTMLQGFREQWNEGEGKDDDVVDSIPEEIPTEKSGDNPSAEEKHEVEASDSHDADASNESSSMEFRDNLSSNPKDIENAPFQNDELISKTLHQPADRNCYDDKLNSLPSLKPNFDINSVSVPNALEYIWFDLANHRRINSNSYKEHTSMPIKSIPLEAIPYDLLHHAAEGMDNFETGVERKNDTALEFSTTMKDLQIKIQTTIGKTWELHHTIQTLIGKALPRLRHTLVFNSISTIEEDHDKQSMPSDGILHENEHQTQVVNENENSGSVVNGYSVQGDAENNVEPLDVVSKDARKSTSFEDNTIAYDVPEGLRKAIARYPSAYCLETLDFSNFKKSIVAKATAKATVGSGSTTSQVGKMEPIFKTLTDEIKILQINQNVHDQFARALVTCYQSILIDMATDIYSTQINHERRLSELEKELMNMRSHKMFSSMTSDFLDLISHGVNSSVLVFGQLLLRMKQKFATTNKLHDPEISLAAEIAAGFVVFVLAFFLRLTFKAKKIM